MTWWNPEDQRREPDGQSDERVRDSDNRRAIGSAYAAAVRTREPQSARLSVYPIRTQGPVVTVTPDGNVLDGRGGSRPVSLDEMRAGGVTRPGGVATPPAPGMGGETPWSRRRMALGVSAETLKDATLAVSVLALGWVGVMIGQRAGRIMEGAVVGLAAGVFIGRGAERLVAAKIGAPQPAVGSREEFNRASARQAAVNAGLNPVFGGRTAPIQPGTAGDGSSPANPRDFNPRSFPVPIARAMQ